MSTGTLRHTLCQKTALCALSLALCLGLGLSACSNGDRDADAEGNASAEQSNGAENAESNDAPNVEQPNATEANPSASNDKVYSTADLLPQLRAQVEKTTPASFDEAGLKEIRAEMDVLVGSPNLPTDPTVKVYDAHIDGPDGNQIRVRIYEPAQRSGTLPCVLWIHGGGMVISNPEGDEAQTIRFAKEINCVVAAPDYRLAPENPYPAGPDDCYATLEWLAGSPSELDIDASRIAVAGASAGGGLTLSTCLRARDQQGPAIAFMMPLYPMMNEKLDTASAAKTYDTRILATENVRYMWDYYLGDTKPGEVTKYMAPAHETDWTGLPPAYTCVGDVDPFRDDVRNWVDNMIAAGNTPEFHLYPGCYHAFEISDSSAEISICATNEYIRVLKTALWPM